MASRPAQATIAAPKTAAKNPGKAVTTSAKKPAPKAARMAAPKKVAETVTLKTVFEQLAAGHDLPKELAQSLLTDFVASATSILKNGDRMRMSGLGIIEVKDRPARMGAQSSHGCVGADCCQQEKGGIPCR
jgi:DNA-binding protein HU-beta